MTINTSESSFFKHQKELENTLVCKRSSAIFAFAYNKLKNINTELIFLDYWSIKNKFNLPKCFLILRNLDGELISRFSYDFKKGSSNSIDLEEKCLYELLSNFLGVFIKKQFSKRLLLESTTPESATADGGVLMSCTTTLI